MWEFIKTTLSYLIFPPMCPVCRKIIDERWELCEKCKEKIFRLDYKKNKPDILKEVFCITNYRAGSQKILHRLKFENDLKFLPTLKKILTVSATNSELKNFLSQIDVAVFVPLHEKRMAERGYNQTDLIFRDFLTAENIPIENFLIRSKFTQKLFSLNQDERKEVLKDAFSATEDIDVKGKNILILDDIYTTGSTVSECAKVLKKFGAKEIFVLAFSSDGN
ncbi:MAG: ComF family protein [Selenomonadaceae bacterium]|nr:ComF family protein [Selenomonadaceae bacterium]